MADEYQYRIFVINPGSTSTKIALFEDEKCVMDEDVFHDSKLLRTFPSINGQLGFRTEVIEELLRERQVDLRGIAAIVGRGGGCYSVPSGIYRINEQLIKDTRAAKGGLYHSSMLGVQLAKEFHDRYGGELLMIDPPVVDELGDLARITGVKGVYRKAISHALNLKETARRYAKAAGRAYEDCRLIVCHIDGGISITAHQGGKMIDGNNAGGGEGPFTPTRMGGLAVTDVLSLLESRSPSELRDLCSQGGGLSSWFGTSDSAKVRDQARNGDPAARRVWEAMIYETAKYIGAMAAVLEGRVDAILLTGGLLRFPEVGETIRRRCGFIAPVYEYPGEFEQEAMAFAALRVLRGQEAPKEYPGHPAWEGFPDN